MPESERIHSETLWITQVRKSPDHPWVDYGTHTSDASSILRTFDYWEENPSSDFPDSRIIRAEVERYVEDPEQLRKMLGQKTAEEKSSELQSN
jgi:hypothetical protein